MRYVPFHRVWLDTKFPCPYRDFDQTCKTVAEVISLIENAGEAFFYIDCENKSMQEELFHWVDFRDREEYVRIGVH